MRATAVPGGKITEQMLFVKPGAVARAACMHEPAATNSRRVIRTGTAYTLKQEMKRVLAIAGFILLAACQKSDVKVLIGGTAIVAPGAQPIEDSIVIVTGHTIRTVGMRKDIPIPQDSERTDLTGKWVVPAEGSRIAIGEESNLLILNHAPHGVAPADAGDISRKLIGGEWK